MADWIDEEFERIADMSAEQPTEQQVSESVARWWEQLGAGIRGNLERVRERNVDAVFAEPQAGMYEVRNAQAGLHLTIELDADARTVRFEYHSDAKRVSEPLGGFLSLRTRGHSRIVPYYSDEAMNQDRVLETVLKPVLFPTEPTEEAA